MDNTLFRYENLEISYAQGKFDRFCVFVTESGKRYAPSDKEYFIRFSQLAKDFDAEKIYDDFVRIYDMTSNKIQESVFVQIRKLAKTYVPREKEMMKWFSVLYAGMVAEENKQYTRLGKRIKRLGMYQVLILKRPPLHAANYSRNRKWFELDDIMTQYGF
jgi:hypothetical protein